MKNALPISVTIVCSTLLVAGVLFWPTLYRYDTLERGKISYLVRIQRITGFTERFDGEKWIPAEGQEPRVKDKNLPYSEASKVTGNAAFRYGGGLFSGKLYNGSSWTVTSVKLGIKSLDDEGSTLWDREYLTDVIISPLSASSFSVTVAGQSGASSEWNIKEVFGHR